MPVEAAGEEAPGKKERELEQNARDIKDELRIADVRRTHCEQIMIVVVIWGNWG
jgi:hypothetical protein